MAIRYTMLTLLAATLFGVIACKPDGPPIYALLRLRHTETRFEMLIMMKTFGEGMCEAALSEFTRAIYENEADMEGWKETERDCREVLKSLYTKIFNDEQVHATYLTITVREGWDYESRICAVWDPRVASTAGVPADRPRSPEKAQSAHRLHTGHRRLDFGFRQGCLRAEQLSG